MEPFILTYSFLSAFLWQNVPDTCFFHVLGPPEMVSGEFLHQGSGESFPEHQQEGHHDVMVTLIIVQLRVFHENPQNNIDQLLLKSFPLLVWHPCVH